MNSDGSSPTIRNVVMLPRFDGKTFGLLLLGGIFEFIGSVSLVLGFKYAEYA